MFAQRHKNKYPRAMTTGLHTVMIQFILHLIIYANEQSYRQTEKGKKSFLFKILARASQLVDKSFFVQSQIIPNFTL